MSRNVGQLTALGTATGLAVVGLCAALFVQVLEVLVDSREVTLEAPAEPVQRTCEQLEELTGEEPWRVTSSELVECPRALDGRAVTYAGEAVRAVMFRGDRAWLQLNDDPYGLAIGPLPEHRTAVGGNSGIPVLVSRSTAEDIRYVGDHRHLGDVIEVTGVFLRAAPFDGGGPAVLADRAAIVRAGRRIERGVSARRIAIASLGIAAAGTLALLGGRR